MRHLFEQNSSTNTNPNAHKNTQPSIFHTQTASRGTKGTAEAGLEGVKQIKMRHKQRAGARRGMGR